MERKRTLAAIGLLLAVCSLLYFWRLGALPLSFIGGPDEPRYAGTARNMVETGNYLVPYFNGKPRYAKPVLTYWLIAASYQVFGVNEFAARLHSAVFATLLVLMTFWFAKLYFGFEGALLSAIAFATCPGLVIAGRYAFTDVVLTFFITAALFAHYRAGSLRGTEKGERGTGSEDAPRIPNPEPRLLWWLGYAAMGLAALTKGPIGFVLPLLASGTYLILSRQLKEFVSKACLPSGIIIFLLIAAPWYVAVHYATHGEFLRVFLGEENLARFGRGKGDLQPFWYFFAITVPFFFPWVAFLPQAWAKAIRLSLKIRNPQSAIRNPDDLALFCTCWSLSIILFFSFSKTKNPQYILPAFPALAVLVGWQLQNTVRRKGLLALLTAVAVLLNLSLLLFVAPAISRRRQQPLRDFAVAASKQLREQDQLVTVGVEESSVVFYAHRTVPRIGSTHLKRLSQLKRDEQAELEKLLRLPVRVDIITKASIAVELRQRYGLKLLKRRHSYAWLSKPRSFSNSPPSPPSPERAPPPSAPQAR